MKKSFCNQYFQLFDVLVIQNIIFQIFNIAGVAPPCMAPDYKQPGDPDDNSYAVKYFDERP